MHASRITMLERAWQILEASRQQRELQNLRAYEAIARALRPEQRPI